MDIQNADYGTVIKFGTLDDFKNKLDIETKSLVDVIDNTDSNGISLLQKALISRKFDIANYLLIEGVKVNVISKDGFNELHYLAANINNEGALDLARLLIERGVNLNQIDDKYGNPAVLSICLELLKRQSEAGMKFIEDILSLQLNIDIVNKSAVSVRKLLNERGTDRIKKLIEEEKA
jgi:ankyrin repeat protein